MQVICSKILKSGKMKRVSGKLLQRGLGVVTLIVTNPDGTQSIKRFKESDYTMTFY
ncbi:hypothetical protein D3C77_340630 [compost metagenome]